MEALCQFHLNSFILESGNQMINSDDIFSIYSDKQWFAICATEFTYHNIGWYQWYWLGL